MYYAKLFVFYIASFVILMKIYNSMQEELENYLTETQLNNLKELLVQKYIKLNSLIYTEIMKKHFENLNYNLEDGQHQIVFSVETSNIKNYIDKEITNIIGKNKLNKKLKSKKINIITMWIGILIAFVTLIVMLIGTENIVIFFSSLKKCFN